MAQSDETNTVLVEGEDYYLEGGLMVLTARYHLRRGYCCEQGCRHCPYGEKETKPSRAGGASLGHVSKTPFHGK